MDIYERMRAGEWIDIRTDEDYRTVARAEMDRSRRLSFRANTTEPDSPAIREILDELFEGRLPADSMILPPFQIDRAKAMTIGGNVLINHGLTCMSSGGIDIEEDVMIGPDAALLTANHDVNDLRVLQFKPIRICKGAWIGARVIILPGITVGAGAVVASGAVVTHDVAPRTIVGGNPARLIRSIDETP